MGLRTGKEPTAEDSFVWRICHALDLTPKELSRAIGVPYKELKPLLTGGQSQLVEIDRDEVWWKIYEFIGTRIGYMLAVRFELDKSLQKDRAKRSSRVERFSDYHGKT